MQTHLLFLCMIFISKSIIGENYCTCQELTEQSECGMTNCLWRENQCTPSFQSCDSYNIEADCNAHNGCTWNQNICVLFTACSDYTIYAWQCYLQNIDECSPIIMNHDGTYLCMQQYTSNCSTMTDENTCVLQGCMFFNSGCYPLYCNFIVNSKNCIYVQDDVMKRPRFCQWNFTTHVCLEASDISQYNKYECLARSGGTYRWNGNSCTSCYGIAPIIQSSVSTSTSTIFLSVFIPLILIFGLLIVYFIRRYRKNKSLNYQQEKAMALKIYSSIDQYSKQTYCSICLSIFVDNSQVGLTKCQHIFHSNCLNTVKSNLNQFPIFQSMNKSSNSQL